MRRNGNITVWLKGAWHSLGVTRVGKESERLPWRALGVFGSGAEGGKSEEIGAQEREEKRKPRECGPVAAADSPEQAKQFGSDPLWVLPKAYFLCRSFPLVTLNSPAKKDYRDVRIILMEKNSFSWEVWARPLTSTRSFASNTTKIQSTSSVRSSAKKNLWREDRPWSPILPFGGECHSVGEVEDLWEGIPEQFHHTWILNREARQI